MDCLPHPTLTTVLSPQQTVVRTAKSCCRTVQESLAKVQQMTASMSSSFISVPLGLRERLSSSFSRPYAEAERDAADGIRTMPATFARSPLPRRRTLRLARPSFGWRFLAARTGREERGHARATRRDEEILTTEREDYGGGIMASKGEPIPGGGRVRRPSNRPGRESPRPATPRPGTRRRRGSSGAGRPPRARSGSCCTGAGRSW